MRKPTRHGSEEGCQQSGSVVGQPDGSAARERWRRADTGGFRDLPSKRLYVFERAGVPKRLRPLVGGKVNMALIDRNWADILRVAATMAAGTMRPSQLLASSSRTRARTSWRRRCGKSAASNAPCS